MSGFRVTEPQKSMCSTLRPTGMAGKMSMGKSGSTGSMADLIYRGMAPAIIMSVPRGAWLPCCSVAPRGSMTMVLSLSTRSISKRVRSV